VTDLRNRRILCAAALAALAGCNSWLPEPVSGPVKMVLASYDSAAGRYKLVKGEVKTLKFLRTMDGDAAKILGGADIAVDYDIIASAKPKSGDELAKLVFKTPGGPVDFAYFESGGMIHPEDFDSLNIATTYYNFERSHLFFVDLNAPLYGLPVQYFPHMVEGPSGALVEQTDNAFWDPVIRTFALLPFKSLDQLPLGMNLGVVGHEFSHAVFEQRVFPEDGVPWLYARYFTDPLRYSPPLNAVRALGEGLGDFFGAAVSEDPAFLRKSVEPAAEARRVDPAQPRCATTQMLDDAKSMPHTKFDPYALGSVLSAVLWQSVSGSPTRIKAFGRGLVDGMTALGRDLKTWDTAGKETTLIACLNTLASTFTGPEKAPVCGLLLDRFGLDLSDLPNCDQPTDPPRPPEVTCER